MIRIPAFRVSINKMPDNGYDYILAKGKGATSPHTKMMPAHSEIFIHHNRNVIHIPNNSLQVVH